MKFSLPAVLAPLAVLALPAEDPSSYYYDVPGNRPTSSVDSLFQKYGKLYFGASTDNGILQKGRTAEIIGRNFGQVTPEYSMKWNETQPVPGVFNFDNADYLVDWARGNGDKVVRGHTLLWYRTVPDWVAEITDAETLTEVIETHITTVVGYFKGKVRSWDVVNEPFNDDGTLRSNVFSDVLGEEYIGIAFRAARAADPGAMLYINEYNLDVAWWDKVTAVVNKVNQWIGEGIPIDGIGSQTHLVPGMAGEIEGALEMLASSGVSEVAITELDIDTAPPDDYATVVAACLNVPKCVGITVWGISDKDSWKGENQPLLFDEDYKQKPAYKAIVSMLRMGWHKR
ncbi:glycosyl hydrolase family 10 [Colletotrichum graminicola M1.001]|uniref:Beta-xylanase n=1 Tax=Colletotrichum graminicola (strain M1.001 / M2 / FGSC 10212) TaxID=645133 RepID=E3QTE3_COLGM|nr:glycosyl hydrolase family 10 [Colletotrichum graminicola M1.001]EFQ34131.1 glycosyl hydrolase family 10 [Colletotrichum graminicola M1.001]